MQDFNSAFGFKPGVFWATTKKSLIKPKKVYHNRVTLDNCKIASTCNVRCKALLRRVSLGTFQSSWFALTSPIQYTPLLHASPPPSSPPPEGAVGSCMAPCHLLLSLLLACCLSLPKIRLAWQILRARSQVRLLNQAIAICLVVSGQLPQNSLSLAIWFGFRSKILTPANSQDKITWFKYLNCNKTD